MYNWCTRSSGIWHCITVYLVPNNFKLLCCLEWWENQICSDAVSYLRKQEPYPHLFENLGTQRTVVFISFKALFTSPVVFWAFPATVVILHHHSTQFLWCPPHPMWNLEFKGNRCTEQPKTQWFIHTGRFQEDNTVDCGKTKDLKLV